MSSLIPYLYVARLRLLMALVYRFEVFSSIFGESILLVTSVYLWKAAYASDQIVENVDMQQMLIFSSLSIILSIFMITQVQNSLVERIRQGQVAIDLMRPIHPLWLWLSEDLGASISSVFIKGIPLILLATLLIGNILPESLSSLALFFPACLLGYLINWALTAIVSLIAFWVLELGNLHLAKTAIVRVLSGSVVPLWFFPDTIETISNFLPFIYIYQFPLSLYIGKISPQESLTGFSIQILWIFLLLSLLQYLWNRAKNHVLIQGG